MYLINFYNKVSHRHTYMYAHTGYLILNNFSALCNADDGDEYDEDNDDVRVRASLRVYKPAV